MRVRCLQQVVNVIVADFHSRLGAKGIDSAHVVHIAGKMVDVVGMHPVIPRTGKGRGPPPPHTNPRIVEVAHLVVFNIYASSESDADAHAAPVLFGAIRNPVVRDQDITAHFPFDRWKIRKVSFRGGIHEKP